MSEAWGVSSTLFLLGAYHGINPGMGWLFAVCLGLQERRRKAVLAALPPIALGHALSVGLIVALVVVLRTQVKADDEKPFGFEARVKRLRVGEAAQK